MIEAAGIYKILNTANGHQYVGSTANLVNRKAVHWSTLKSGIHSNRYLQNAWNKYGPEAFEFRLIGHCTVERLIELEQEVVDHLRPKYNISLVIGSCLGVKRSAETRRKIGAAKTGNKYSLGLTRSVETCQKISAAKIGNKNCVGRTLSAETRRKISEAHKGTFHTIESRQKMSTSQKRRAPDSAETRLKKSRAATGRRHPGDVRHKMKESQKRRRIREKSTYAILYEIQ